MTNSIETTAEFWKEQIEFPGLGRKLRLLMFPPNEGGCSFYRVLNPVAKLIELYSNVIEVKRNDNPLNLDLSSGKFDEDNLADIEWADIVITNNICNFGGNYTARVLGKVKEKNKLFHFDTDDLLINLFPEHRLYSVYKEKGLEEITKFIYTHSDLVSVTQVKFAHRVKDYCHGILAVIKNAIDYNLECWNAPKFKTPKKGLTRVGWAGGIHHSHDVKEFLGVPQMVNQRVGKENVHWGFYGKPPVEPGKEDWQQDVWEDYRKALLAGFRGSRNWDIYGALPADKYGIMYANMDVAIAPLNMNEFNDSKSEIKVAECGRYGVPLVASNVGCYEETIKNGKTGYLIDPKSPRTEWVRVLTKLIKDKKHREELGQNLKKITDEYFDLNKVVHNRLTLYRELLKYKGIIKGGNDSHNTINQ